MDGIKAFDRHTDLFFNGCFRKYFFLKKKYCMIFVSFINIIRVSYYKKFLFSRRIPEVCYIFYSLFFALFTPSFSIGPKPNVEYLYYCEAKPVKYPFKKKVDSFTCLIPRCYHNVTSTVEY